MRHLWVLELGISLLAYTMLRCRRSTVFAASVGPWAQRLIRLANATGFWTITVQQIHPHLGFEDGRGQSLSYELENRLVALSRSVVPEEEDTSWLPSEMRHLAREWRGLLRAEFIDRNREEGVLPLFVERAYELGEVQGFGAEVECFVCPVALPGAFAQGFVFHPGPTARLRWWPSRKLMVHLLHVIPGRPAFWLSLIKGTMTGTAPAHPAASLDPEALAKGTVLQQGYLPAFERYPNAGHLYWVEGGGLDPSRVVLFCNRPDSPYEVMTSTAASKGFGTIDASSLLAFLDHPFATLRDCLRHSLHAFPRRAGSRDVWRWMVVFFHLVKIAAYGAMYRSVNALAVHHTNNFTADAFASLVAMKLNGVLSFYNQWSIYQRLAAMEHDAFADLLIAWGGFHRGHMLATGHHFRWMAEVGMVAGDGTGDDDPALAAALRAKLSPTVSFVVAVFDTGNDYSSHSRLEDVLTFYTESLAEIRANPTWGCLIKTKGNALERLPRVPGLQDVIAELEAEGRCLRLSGWERIAVAMIASDLAVSTTINSAGIEAAMTGRPSLHLELAGLVHHPFRLAGGDGVIILDDVDAYRAAMRKVAAGDKSVGDHGALLDTVDAFRDGKGRFRVAELIGEYVRGRDAGLDDVAALDRSVDAYATRWGTRFIHAHGKMNDDEGIRLWRLSKQRGHSGWPGQDA